MGCIDACKGIYDLQALADFIDEPIHIYGQGDITLWKHEKLIYKGVLHGKERDKIVGEAKAIIMFSRFTEPFAIVTGPPVICVDYGAYTETVEQGKNGISYSYIRRYG